MASEVSETLLLLRVCVVLLLLKLLGALVLKGFRLGVQGSEAWEVLCTPSKLRAGAAWDLLFRVEPRFMVRLSGAEGPLPIT